jgi:hypothetical protein
MDAADGDHDAAAAAAAQAPTAAADAADAARVQAFVAQSWAAAAAALEEAYGAIGAGGAARLALESLRDAADTRLRVLLPPTLDKAVRKAAHDALHTHLPDLVDADTIDEPVAAAARAAEVAAEKGAMELEAALAAAVEDAAAAAAAAKPDGPAHILNPMDRFKRDTYSIAPPPPKPSAPSASAGASAAAAGLALAAKAEAAKAASAASYPKLPMCLRVWRRPPRGQKRGKLVGAPVGEVSRDSRSNLWQQRARAAWPSGRPEYLRFALYKVRVETFDFSFISASW